MKFVIAVVMLAIASAQAGVLPAVVDVSSAWGAPAWGHSWGSPWASPLALPSLTTWGSPINPWNVGVASHLGVPSHLGISSHLGVPSHLGLHGVSPVLGHGHDGQYVAANRGSVHVAPLVGHIQSVSSSNVQPAPGTTW